MRRPYGAEVVGRRARVLRSDGGWHAVVVTGYDRAAAGTGGRGLHELRFVGNAATGAPPSASAAYDLNHPARHVRWVDTDGTTLLPVDEHPCPERAVDDDTGGVNQHAAGAATTCSGRCLA